MKVVSPEVVSGKRVLLRMDLDVPIEGGRIVDDTRLLAGMDTLDMCLSYAKSVVVMGHIGRPHNKIVPELSVKPIVAWIEQMLAGEKFEEDVLHVLENLRFEPGEDACDLNYAKELASLGEVYVNESFAAHHPSASTTVLPTLLPSYAGFQFADEVKTITEVREHPKKPVVAVIGGVKVEDKYPAVVGLAKFCDAVMVGGLLAKNIQEQNLKVATNVMLGRLASNGIDMSLETIDSFVETVKSAKQLIWAGPLGKYEDPQGNQGDLKLAEAVTSLPIDSIIGGGDTIAALRSYLDKFSFVSTGGGAMLELLIKGILPSIEALDKSPN